MIPGGIDEAEELSEFIVFLKSFFRGGSEVVIFFKLEGFFIRRFVQVFFYFFESYRGIQAAILQKYLIAAVEVQAFFKVGAPPKPKESRMQGAAVVGSPQLKDMSVLPYFKINPCFEVAGILHVDISFCGKGPC
jgi:hypothetical protein